MEMGLIDACVEEDEIIKVNTFNDIPQAKVVL